MSAPTAVAPPRAWERQPQWWLWAVGFAGACVLGAVFVAGVPTTGHAGHGAFSAAHAAAWVAMVAVMAPLIAPNVRFAARRSPRRARGPVARDVAGGWALVWLAAAVVLGVGGAVLVSTLGELVAIALLTVAAVGWQYSPRKRQSLARCHAVLAPPLDRRRSRQACRAYGVALGRDCVRSCWPLMALMVVAAHDPLVVAATVGVAWYERRRRPHHDPATRATAVVIVATGVVAIAVADLLGRH